MNMDKKDGKIFDRTFSDRKLTREEFNQKYWLDGEAVYQFHTPNIEDGRDEREQFIFNDIRALDNRIDYFFNLESEARCEISQKLHKLEETISSAQDKLDELRRAVTAIDKALHGVGLEIDQPSNMEEPGYIVHPPYSVSAVLYSHKDAGEFIDCCKEE